MNYKLDMYNFILPPSTNWFQPNATSIRREDCIIAAGSFKSIVIYNIPQDEESLKVIQTISLNSRVLGVSLYPYANNLHYGSSLAVIGCEEIFLYCINSGSLLSKQNIRKIVNSIKSLNSLCWANVKNEDTVVVVGDKGNLFLWQPKNSILKSLVLEIKKDLTVVEALPHRNNEALVAAEKIVLHICLMNGDILSQFRGHDDSIYSIKVCPSSCIPHDLQSKKFKLSTEWRKDSENGVEDDCTIIFATSDYSRNVLIWDLIARRYIRHGIAPICTSASRKVKDRDGKNKHISLCWAQNRLYSSTVIGEIIEWNLGSDSVSSESMKFKLVGHYHSGVIYNMESKDSLILSFSSDRIILGYDLASKSSRFKIETIGSCPSVMAFSPHDSNRLALGMHSGGIKFLILSRGKCLNVKSIGMNIKDKILSISWHPTEEGKLLFGTSEGQVGLVNVLTMSIRKFAFHHQKAVYKVEWGLAIAPHKTGLAEDTYYPYSFGNREILAFDSTDFMKDPIVVNEYLEHDCNTKKNFSFTEFSFSPDYKLLATGDLFGEIRIYDRLTLTCYAVIFRVRKVIQHLLWKTDLSPEGFYTLAVASGELSVYLFDIPSSSRFNGDVSVDILAIHQPKTELLAHANRTVWLSWSSHDSNLLASASYDSTVQIWDLNSGTPLGNYGLHNRRVFRVEFSPENPDSVFSIAEENCVHEWKISKLIAKTPKESLALLKEVKKQSVLPLSVTFDEAPIQNSKAKNEESLVKSSSKYSCASSSRKSSFPLFRNTSSRKRSFHHMCILSLAEAKVHEKNVFDIEEDDRLSEEDLEASNSSHINGISNLRDSDLKIHASSALEKYKCFIPEDQPCPEVEDICFYLNFFGSVPQIGSVFHREIDNHDASDNISRGNLMHCWQGSIESRIRWAASRKCLDSFLVSVAPQVSFSLWQFACEAYADQLVEAKDYLTAASYLVSIHKDEEAVYMLIKNKYFLEAFVIAKYKLGFNKEVIDKVINAWSALSIYEGNFELSCILNLHVGNLQTAAKTLSRRSEVRSLVVASQLYLMNGQLETAEMSAILAFQEASSKNEFYKFEPVLMFLPSLNWCRIIHICQQAMLDRIFRMKKCSGMDSSLLVEDEGLKEESVANENLFLDIMQKWEENHFTPDRFAEYYWNIKKINIQNLPSSLKHLWYMLALSITEMILVSFYESDASVVLPSWNSALQAAFKYINLWGKVDQMFYFTHLLLPKGILSEEKFLLPTKNNEDCSDIIKTLYSNYVSSEIEIISSFLTKHPSWVPWGSPDSRNGGDANNCDGKDGINGNCVPNAVSCDSRNGLEENGIHLDTHLASPITKKTNTDDLGGTSMDDESLESSNSDTRNISTEQQPAFEDSIELSAKGRFFDCNNIISFYETKQDFLNASSVYLDYIQDNGKRNEISDHLSNIVQHFASY